MHAGLCCRIDTSTLYRSASIMHAECWRTQQPYSCMAEPITFHRPLIYLTYLLTFTTHASIREKTKVNAEGDVLTSVNLACRLRIQSCTVPANECTYVCCAHAYLGAIRYPAHWNIGKDAPVMVNFMTRTKVHQVGRIRCRSARGQLPRRAV